MARALAAIAVVALHAIGYSLTRDLTPAAQQADQVLILSLRFARQVFMCISGFALAYAYRDRPISYGPFLLRRFWKVALPYVAWSAIYLLIAPTGGQTLKDLLTAVALGTAFYHLYYVVVSLQWYLIFPPVLALAKRLNAKAALWAATTTTALYLALGAWLTIAPIPHRDQLLPSYLGYYLLGTLGGIHAEAVLTWTRRHLWPITAAIAGLLGYLTADMIHAGTENFAQSIDIFRPGLVMYGLTGALLLLACAGHITRAGGKLLEFLLALSKNSYAIYLAHPLVLYFAESYVLSHLRWTPWLSLPLITAGVLLPHTIARKRRGPAPASRFIYRPTLT